jgi:hypothetical protein
MPKLEQDGALWRCSSPMMRASVQSRRGLAPRGLWRRDCGRLDHIRLRCFGGRVHGGGPVDIFWRLDRLCLFNRLGRFDGFDTSAFGCRVSACSSFEASDRLREPAACADADARTSAAIRMNLRL